MPTIYFEYTENLNISDKLSSFLVEVHHILVDIIKTDLPTCRSLITSYSDYVVGDGDPKNSFLQLTVKMLPGRTESVKQKLGNILFEKMQKTFEPEIDKLTTQIRVYLQETDINYYYGLEH